MDEIEHIALGGALGIPPAPPVMVDDDHLALVPAIFQGAACAALAVQLPGRRRPLQQDGAAYPLPELIQFGVMPRHRTSLLMGIGGCAVGG